MQPIIAFLGEAPGVTTQEERLDLLERFNVDVIPYPVVAGSHQPLEDLVRAHGSLILGRSLHFGQPQIECPSYDPETTGLLVYNHLALKGESPVTQDALNALVRARVLALLNDKGTLTVAELNEDLIQRTQLVREISQLKNAGEPGASHTIAKALADLDDLKLVEIVQGAFGEAVQLTSDGRTLTEDQAGTAARLAGQFSASINARTAATLTSPSDDLTERIGEAAEAFLKDCATRRALGVAMVWQSPTSDFQRFHIVALLQELPRYAAQLNNIHEGRILVEVVRGVFSSPTDGEAIYLGALVQAQFGLHLMGFDPDTFAARARDLSTTLFLLDSTTLIPYLARSSNGHPSARQLVAQMRAVSASPVTTDLLSLEVAEHARWALRSLGSSKISTLTGLALATGRAGANENVFIEGCLAEAAAGKAIDLHQYLDSICADGSGHRGSNAVFAAAFEREGIPCHEFAQWEGFKPELYEERDRYRDEIAKRRLANSTYQHDRQCQAEAEALMIVQRVRDAAFRLDDRTFTDAYFLSNTRVIDDVIRPTRPVTMRPHAVQQWLSTLTACSPDELRFVINGILWELSERGMSIVDMGRVRTVFAPLVDASKRQLEEELAHHRNLIADRYGENAANAFAEIGGVDAPFIAESYFARKSAELEKSLLDERAQRERIAKTALSDQERQELQRLKGIQKRKEEKTRLKRRKIEARKRLKRTKKRR